ncbi:MAG: hypothetical protein H0U10_08680 [Chloroflexia bacterium]|nr:hypothetical protein [Chloroflexia bacterium]
MFTFIDTLVDAAAIEQALAVKRAERLGPLLAQPLPKKLAGGVRVHPSTSALAAVAAVLASLLGLSLVAVTGAQTDETGNETDTRFRGEGAGRVDLAAEVARAGMDVHLEMVMLSWPAAPAAAAVISRGGETAAPVVPAGIGCGGE